MYKPKNELKNLIYIQENKPCNEQTINGLFRSIVEPILEKNVESLILFRLEEKSKSTFNALLKRLEYSNAKVYDFSDSKINDKFEYALKENIWDKTEFVYVLTERFGAALIFDFEDCEIENFANMYILHNSKNLSEVFDTINSNSKIDLTQANEKYHPDRRDNEVLNLSIRKLVENLNEKNEEILISELAKENPVNISEVESRLDFILTKSSHIAHEMRNLLSICNLYSTIIDKQSSKIKIENKEAEKSILNARDCIRKSLQMVGNLLLDFKSMKNNELEEHDLKTVTENALALARIYANGKEISFSSNIEDEITVLVDENKFLAVIINLIKNAVESIEKKGDIVIKSEIEGENAKLIISNTGNAISKEIQEKLFSQGFTTKTTGSGLGLAICKKTLEEQFAQIKLKKSDENSTEFEISILRGGV